MFLINILLVDDHTLFAKSLSVALDGYNEIEHFYSTQDIQGIGQMVCDKNIDIILMDINLGNLSDTDGLEIASNLLKSSPMVKVIVLTGYDLPVYRHEAKKIGISGFLNKNISPDDLISSLIHVSRGNTCFPSESNEIMIEDLTSMEKKILQLISSGKKRKCVADELYMSERTLSNHLQHIFEKLDVSSVVEAVTKAIKDISFSVEKGEFLGIMGTSGSGKTTLLHCISTIDTVSAGHIYLEGKDVTEIKPKSLARFRRENLGFVFQDFNLLDTLTISENIALALAINHTPARSVEPRILEIAGKLNISDILNKYPYQVSGGQKQRCACARAIINNPRLLLADEPTGALDSHSSQMLLSTIQSINEQLRATILMVTHDAFTASYASRILFLKDGEIFMELRKGNDSRNAFFDKILNVLTIIGGGQSHVC